MEGRKTDDSPGGSILLDRRDLNKPLEGQAGPTLSCHQTDPRSQVSLTVSTSSKRVGER